MWTFLHHLFNPHCPQCKAELAEKLKVELDRTSCPTCPVYKAELEKAQEENVLLLKTILEKNHVGLG